MARSFRAPGMQAYVIHNPLDPINMRNAIMSIFRREMALHRATGRRAQAGHRPARGFRPRLLALEERTLLSHILTVTNTQDSGDGSLRAAVAAAQPGDTIVFSHKVYGKTITLTSGPIVATGTSLTIQGPGADELTASGNNESGIFNLVPADPSLPPFTVTITGLTLADAAGPDSSPSYAINDTNASLTLDHDVIAGNQSGGVSVLNGYQNGTPIYAINVNVTNSAFLDNRSDQSGAAIIAASVVFHLSQSLFEGNSATSASSIGGALYLTNSTFDTFTSSTIDSSLFIGNTAVSDGGAIENFGGPITINSSTFIDNRSSFGGAIENLWGNVFFAGPLPTGAFNLTNSTFLDNQAIGLYGGFYGGGEGGAIHFVGINAPISISGSTFVGNRAEGGAGGSGVGGSAFGGAIDTLFPNVVAPLTIAQSTFKDNEAIGGNGDTNGGTAQGGAILLSGVKATITGSQFIDNSAVGGSGGSGDTFPFFNTLFQSAFGGAIELAAFEASITGCAFVGNSAIGGNGGPGEIAGAGEGGAVDNQFTPLTLSADTFTGNRALGGTGGNATSGSNASGGAGGEAVGGAFANSDFLPFGTMVSLTGLTFIDNRAVGGVGGTGDGSGSGGVGGDALGGAVLNQGGLSVSSGTFIGDLARGGHGGHGGSTGSGGAGGNGYSGGIDTGLFGDPSDSSVLAISSGTFIGNRAIGGEGGEGSTDGTDGQGLDGAIAILAGPATITKSKFSGNKASTSGDDIYGNYTT
jgi:hypothetical protein